MRRRSLEAALIFILAVLGMSGCGKMTETANPADAAGADFRRDHRGDFGGSRYPGPPLTGGGN